MGHSQAFSPSSGLVLDSCLNRYLPACMMERTTRPACKQETMEDSLAVL